MPLVANDGSWAVCLPKKTGSQSLVGMLCASEHGGDGLDVAKVQGDWHGAEWDGAGRRLMVVRNPYERLASMYWYSLHEGVEWLRGPGGPIEWLHRWLRRDKCQREWYQTQSELAAAFQPVQVFRLEDGLANVLAALGLSVPHIQHRNPTGGKKRLRLSFAETFAEIDDALRWVIDQWCLPDMEAWY